LKLKLRKAVYSDKISNEIWKKWLKMDEKIRL
jgi:hypothetical protein